jgi:hypothetical protein
MGLVAIISPHEWRIEQKGDRKFLSAVCPVGGASYTSPRFFEDSDEPGLAELAPPKIFWSASSG